MEVKVGLDGQAYLDGAAVTLEELAGRIAVLNREGGALTYYRESPATDGTDASAATFQAIIDLRPVIVLGSNAPSEWGRLEWVEVEEAPMVSRFFLARGERFLISAPGSTSRAPASSNPGDAEPPVVVGGPLSAEVEDDWLGWVDLLIRSDRVIETPPRQPELAMQEPARSRPSLHLRIAYDRRRWASWYPAAVAPSHILSFNADLWRLARHLVTGAGRRLSPAEAKQFFR
jgi:hypothetical protein